MKLPVATKWNLGTCTRVLDNRLYEVDVSGRKYWRNRRQLRASQERPPTPPVAGMDPEIGPEQSSKEPENRSIVNEPNLEHIPLLDGETSAETIGNLPRRSACTKYTPVWHKDYVMIWTLSALDNSNVKYQYFMIIYNSILYSSFIFC
jgi:hypothetical protein